MREVNVRTQRIIPPYHAQSRETISRLLLNVKREPL